MREVDAERERSLERAQLDNLTATHTAEPEKMKNELIKSLAPDEATPMSPFKRLTQRAKRTS